MPSRERSWRSTFTGTFSRSESDFGSSPERDRDAQPVKITPFEHTIRANTPPGDFTFCEEALTFIPTEVVQYFSNGDRERKIHTNTEFTEEESRWVGDFIKLVERKRISLSPFVLSSASRFVWRTRGDITKAIHLARLNHEWRQSFFTKPLTDDASEPHVQFLKHGIVYVPGRDKHLRPIFVVRCHRILPSMMNEKDCAVFIKMLAFMMEYIVKFMMMPGVVENISIIFDMEGFKLGWNTMKFLKQVYNVFNSHYNGRVFRFYVLNPPSFISFMLAIFKPLMNERQKQKLMVIPSGEKPTVLHQQVASSQLEQRYGGDRPEIKTFYPIDLNPGPFEPTISEGSSVKPNFGAAQDCHKVLTEFNSVGPLLLDPAESRGTRPQERIKLGVSDAQFKDLIKGEAAEPGRFDGEEEPACLSPVLHFKKEFDHSSNIRNETGESYGRKKIPNFENPSRNDARPIRNL